MLYHQRNVTVPLTEGAGLHNPDMRVVLEMSNRLAEMDELPDVLDAGLETMLRIFHLDSGRVYLLDQDHPMLELAAARGIDVKGLEHMALGQGFSGKAAASRSFLAQRVADLDNPDRARFLASLGLCSVVCLPLIALGQVVDTMNLGCRRVIELDTAKIELMVVLGNLLAVAIMNVRQAQALREQARELEYKKDSLRFLAYTAAHDLKSPATAIRGLTNMLVRQAGESLDSKGRSICDQIAKAAEVVDELAGELNAYTRAREADLEVEPVDLAELLAEIRGRVAEELERRGVDWQQELSAGQVHADRLDLTRTITNLVDNALKYGGPGLGLLKIGCRAEPGVHHLWVIDDGVGVPAEERERVFTLFGRGTTSKGQPGTGLGLAVVAETARRHGGRVWLEENPGGGAAVHLLISRPEGDEAER